MFLMRVVRLVSLEHFLNVLGKGELSQKVLKDPRVEALEVNACRRRKNS